MEDQLEEGEAKGKITRQTNEIVQVKTEQDLLSFFNLDSSRELNTREN